MITLSILVGFLLILLIGFLFTPMTLYIDTDEGRYEFAQIPAFRFLIEVQDERIIPRLQVIGVDISLNAKTKKKPVPDQPGQVTKKRTKSPRFHKSVAAWRFLIEQSLKSFTIKRVVVDLDTDNFALNANLVPVFLWASHGPVQLSSNFNGRVYFHLDIRNRPARILWIFLQFLTKK